LYSINTKQDFGSYSNSPAIIS